MALPNELVTQLVKIVGNRGNDNQDYTVYGTIVEVGDQKYVQLDGSDIKTPFESTVEVNTDDRVMVEVKDHTATVTGNTTNPSIGTKTANGFRSSIEQNANNIKLAVENIGKTQASIELLPDSIKSTVKQEYFDPLDTTINGANGINARLESAESTIEQMPNQITSTVKETYIDPIDGKVEGFSEFKQTVEGFSFMNAGGTVKISGGDINLTGAISFSDLTDSSTVQKQIDDANSTASSAKTTASSAKTTASSAKTTASNALDKVNGWAHSANGTYIDGSMIYSDSIYADKMHLGGLLTVYQTKESTSAGGYIGYDSGFNSTSGIGVKGLNGLTQMVCSNQAARLSYGSVYDDSIKGNRPTDQFVASAGSAVMKSDTKAHIVSNDQVLIEAEGNVVIDSSNAANYGIIFKQGGTSMACFTGNSFRSYPLNTDITLGVSGQKWKALYVDNVYAETCTGTTSDRSLKNSIEDLPEKYLILFDNLRPVRYKLNDGTSNRYHIGYIAQEVEDAMVKAGIDSTEFGGLIKEKDEDGNEYYMLRYDEFDGIRDVKIKQLETKLNEAYGIIDELKTRLDKLEAKEVS